MQGRQPYMCVRVCVYIYIPNGLIVTYNLLGSYFYVIGISYDKMQFTCLLSVLVLHMMRITCLLSAFKKNRYEANQNNQF